MKMVTKIVTALVIFALFFISVSAQNTFSTTVQQTVVQKQISPSPYLYNAPIVSTKPVYSMPTYKPASYQRANVKQVYTIPNYKLVQVKKLTGKVTGIIPPVPPPPHRFIVPPNLTMNATNQTMNQYSNMPVNGSCPIPIPGNWTNSTPTPPPNTTNSSYPQPCCGNGVCDTAGIFGPETPGSCPSDCHFKCSDGRDNDGDSLRDFFDPGCHQRGILGTPFLPNRDCELEPFVCGDFNKDGSVTVTDSLFIGRFLSGGYIPTQQQKYCGDVNNDGQVTAVDADLISMRSAGQPIVLRCPVQCTRNSC